MKHCRFDFLRHSITLFLTFFKNLFHVCGVFKNLAFLYALLRFLICLLIAVVIQGGSEGRIQIVMFGMHSIDSVIM